MTRAEREAMSASWNSTEPATWRTHDDSPHDFRTVGRLFEEQAARTPDAIAVLAGDEQITYAELNARANRLAHRLLELGVQRESLVGLCLKRSARFVEAVLATLKAAAAYVPLDPEYPRERLTFMLGDIAAQVIITDGECAPALPESGATTILLDRDADPLAQLSAENPRVAAAPSDLIYVMYTSGSTGRPKGVMIEHRGVIRLTRNPRFTTFDARDRFLMMAPVSFDASTLELWAPLLNGGSIAVMPPVTQSLAAIGDAIQRYQVTSLWLPAGLFNVFIDQAAEALRPLRKLITGGDAASLAHFRKARELLAECSLINGYGPTETTTFAVCLAVRAEHLHGVSVPIGRPIAKTRVFILDAKQWPVADGEVGELCIAGHGVARGYLNQPELTTEKFVTIAMPEGRTRIYHTGDRARRLADGTIEFLGRLDEQVKVSGYRVEPAEIAAALREHRAVRDAVVIAEEDGQTRKRLVAYVVPRWLPAPSANELREFVASKLPQFMVPAAVTAITEIPLTANGKVDRATLARGRADAAARDASSAPHAALEKKIAAIWCEVLGLPVVSVDDSFFDIGGDSLALTEVHVRLAKALPSSIPITDLFQYPTVRTLADRLTSASSASSAANDTEQRAMRQREVLARRRRQAAV
jgi:amino acid adenylation domain-containing protein